MIFLTIALGAVVCALWILPPIIVGAIVNLLTRRL